MKLNEPFSGIGQLCAHSVVHLAFGTFGLYLVTIRHLDFIDTMNLEEFHFYTRAYRLLIAAHFCAFIIQTINYFYLRTDPNPSLAKADKVENEELDNYEA